ncbi:glycosyltransferase, family 2 [Campylobacter lari]|uniref:glycosyltransferase family 2 protein n=1 Tax=Campylobacter lari TaxID=201 RepID=UPI002152261A|nr:glycosyltransferase family 2 protein [Campylobacter lari]MCR6536029.1 glycosyltransferase family 2 protein [Campylobacter lari]
MKTVGVVIPIYNVEKYLKECLDSVINQTYTNLEIILVNDGSTDENSLNIAKEYTLKDKRITLFDKKNGGQSTARNVGIEYFSGEYKLKNKTQAIKENSLIEFSIEGNNPYEIYTVYKSYKAFNDEQDLTSFTYPSIDYIIFLDSDDYWELNCIEECVPRMDGVDVLWFDSQVKYEDVIFKQWISLLKQYDIKENIITSKEWLKLSVFIKIKSFYFTWSGMINFNFMRNIKLKFINYIVHQDHHFGMMLFFYAQRICILAKELHVYRVYRDSTINSISFNSNKIHIPLYMQEICKNTDREISYIKKYHSAISMYFILKQCYNSIESFHDKEAVALFQKAFFDFLLERSFKIYLFSYDPCQLKQKLKKMVISENFNWYWKFLTNFLSFFIFLKIKKTVRKIKCMII